ncbi:hypothetical protein D3C75_938030 [compost metagenome]
MPAQQGIEVVIEVNLAAGDALSARCLQCGQPIGIVVRVERAEPQSVPWPTGDSFLQQRGGIDQGQGGIQVGG